MRIIGIITFMLMSIITWTTSDMENTNNLIVFYANIILATTYITSK